MKRITGYYKRLRLRKIEIAVLAVFVSIFFLPSFVPFEKTGNNMFTVLLNDVQVGVVADPKEAQNCALEARRHVAGESEELILVESNVVTEGSEVLWGKVDDPEQITEKMIEVLSGDVKETLHRSYVVKINEYMVNLSDKEEVRQLLQAALNKYDEEGQYQVDLMLDPTRELNVLTTQIISQEEAASIEEVEAVSLEAGIEAELTAAFEEVEPTGEMDFEDYDLGLISMEYGDEIEVV